MRCAWRLGTLRTRHCGSPRERGEGRSLTWATAVHFRMKTIDKRTSSFRSGGAAEGAGNAARLPCPVVLSKSGLTLSRLYKPHTKPDMATATRAAVAHSNLLFSMLRQFCSPGSVGSDVVIFCSGGAVVGATTLSQSWR